jgi:hypothetical protein
MSRKIMSRRILFLAALAAFAVSGQGQSTSQNSTQYSTPYNGPFGGPILVTPNASLPSPAPAAGISDAGRAGISANPAPANSGETVPMTTFTTTTVTESAPSSVNTETAPEANTEASTNDLGVSVSVNNGPVAAPISVAEAATRFKTDKTALNARVLSNEDVRLIVNRDSNGRSMALDMPPPNPASEQSAAQPQEAQTSAPPAQPGQEPAPSAAANQQQPADTQTSSDNATTPQINQNQQSNDAQGTTRLPATATILPLLGLLGLASAGFGLLFRRFKNKEFLSEHKAL